jgi:hypothetical protein
MSQTCNASLARISGRSGRPRVHRLLFTSGDATSRFDLQSGPLVFPPALEVISLPGHIADIDPTAFEAVAHLIEVHLRGRPTDAVCAALVNFLSTKMSCSGSRSIDGRFCDREFVAGPDPIRDLTQFRPVLNDPSPVLKVIMTSDLHSID